jgi:hypothetical protein
VHALGRQIDKLIGIRRVATNASVVDHQGVSVCPA